MIAILIRIILPPLVQFVVWDLERREERTDKEQEHLDNHQAALTALKGKQNAT